MNAGTYTGAVDPVLAVSKPKRFKHQQRNWQPEKRVTKKNVTFDSLFQTANNADDDMMFQYIIGCYGKDAKPVVGSVSSFNQAT